MTSRATKAAPVTPDTTEAASEPTETKKHAVYTLRGRDIEFKAPTAEQLMVMRRLSRQLGEEGRKPSRTLITLAKILDAVSACMVSEDDVDYVDQLVLDRKLGVDELAPMITVAIAGDEGLKAQAPTTGPKPRVRRR